MLFRTILLGGLKVVLALLFAASSFLMTFTVFMSIHEKQAVLLILSIVFMMFCFILHAVFMKISKKTTKVLVDEVLTQEEKEGVVIKEYKASRFHWYMIFFLLLFILLYCSYAVINMAAPVLMFFLSIIISLFLYLFILIVKGYSKVRHPLIIKSTGLKYKPLADQFSISFVPWKEIEQISIVRMLKTWPIAIKLREGELSSNVVFSKPHKHLFGKIIYLHTNSLETGIDSAGLNPINKLFKVFIAHFFCRNKNKICDDINKAIEDYKNSACK